MYSFGTDMVVPGYNNSQPVKVLDRGRVIRGNRLDVFFNSHDRAKVWGVRYLPVEVRAR
jgi:3D (Asp-Asp-Asp) domain-containing protein